MNRPLPSSPRIDVHSHFVVDPPQFAEQRGDNRWPSLYKDKDGTRLIRDGRPVRALPASALSLADRVPALDMAGIDHQVLSPARPLICEVGNASADEDWARRINAGMAALVDAQPQRFSALGILPLSHPDSAVDVLAEAKELGLSGVEIGTTAGARELDHPDLTEFLQAAAELEMLVFIHPIVLGSTAPWTSRIDTLETNVRARADY